MIELVYAFSFGVYVTAGVAFGLFWYAMDTPIEPSDEWRGVEAVVVAFVWPLIAAMMLSEVFAR